MSGDQVAAGLKKTTEQSRGDGEGRIGYDLVGLARQRKAASIGPNDHDGVTEALAKVPGSLRMWLNGDDPRPGGDQWGGERSQTSADIQDNGARGDPRVSDKPPRPTPVELVPSPPPLRRGHGERP